MAAARSDRDQAIADIEAHLATHGPGDWTPVRARYPDLPEATFWRWVRAARLKPAGGTLVETARKELAERTARMSGPEATAAAVSVLPAAPSPDFIAKNGAQGVVHLNLLERFEQMFADAILLREYSLTDEGRVKNPIILGQSIDRRDALLNTALRATQKIWDLQRNQAFYDLIVEEIGKASPEVARAITVRLAELNERVGFSEARV